jgi:UPF0755 protein
MKKFIFILILIFIVIFCFWFAVISCFWFWQNTFVPKQASCDSKQVFSIEKGQGAKEIAFNLENQGLIKNMLLFRVYVLSANKSKQLKAGDYTLNPCMAIPEIVESFVSGDVIKQKITIIEGWTIEIIGGYLEEKGIIERGKFFYGLNSVLDKKDFSNDFVFLPKGQGVEKLRGFLFPDTYYIYKGMGVEQIARMMLENFDAKLTQDLEQDIGKQDKTIYDIITMASLIEKEVRTMEDKKIVSGILWKRMEIGMPLQVDATISLITGIRSTKISRKQLEKDSPYNTYKYLGLPIGPICNPGIESITAAIYPETSEFWYYLSTPEGETIFSATLEQHNIAKAKYL